MSTPTGNVVLRPHSGHADASIDVYADTHLSAKQTPR